MIRAAFFDVDGTLLSHKTKGIPASARAAVANLRAKGIKCIVATGRQMSEMRKLPIADMEFDGYITLNGQLILDGEKQVLDGVPITGRVKDFLVECFREHRFPALLVERVSGGSFHSFVEREVCARADLGATGFLRNDELPGDAALGYLYDEGLRTNVLHLPVRGNGDGGIYSTADDLHRFWGALTSRVIVGEEMFQVLTTPRHAVPEEGMRYAAGLWLHEAAPLLVIEGADAGVSFRSTHDPATGATVSVLGNSSDGAWPVIGELEDLLLP